jgi:ligand-binding SRPBCC domain-containing protein
MVHPFRHPFNTHLDTHSAPVYSPIVLFDAYATSRIPGMVRIELETPIAAPRERCFDLSRDLDLHRKSLSHTDERAVGGRLSGLIELGEQVTWRGRHFGLELEHCARITAFDRPRHFRDSMVSGLFQSFEHDHFFETNPRGTLMRDVLEFRAPLGFLGRIIEALVLKRYLTNLLTRRNDTIKREAERPEEQD